MASQAELQLDGAVVMRTVALGRVSVRRTCKQTGDVVLVHDDHNVLVDGFFDTIVDLIDQQAADPPAYRRIAQMWIESDNIGLPAADGSDTGPDPDSTIMAQYWFDAADRTQVTANTVLGPLRAVQFRASIDGDTYAGSTVVAAGMFTAGSLGAPPNPALWTPGDDDVHLVARALVGPLAIVAGFTFDLAWTVACGRLPDALL